MTRRNTSEAADRITRTIIETLANLFAEPEFDNDDGVVKFLDRDDKCVWLGLFPTNEDGEVINDAPSVTWTIEISQEAKGPRS
jgi:hypothetical protein